MKFSKSVLSAAAALALSVAAVPAQAVVTYNLDQTAVGAFLPAPFGSVSLDDSVANQVTVTVDLFNGFQFVDTGSHHAFGFNLNTDGYSVTATTPSGFTWLDGSFTQSGFGTFSDGFDCVACGSGASSPVPPPLKFTVQGSGLTASSFVGSSTGFLFTADVFGNGLTGPIASGDTPVPGVPEPETYALMLAGLGVVGFMARRRKPQA